MSPSVDDTGQQFINGRRRHGSSSDPLTVTNPSTGDVVATCTLASVGDVDEAVAVAKAAFPGWAGATPAERSTAMHKFAAELETVAREPSFLAICRLSNSLYKLLRRQPGRQHRDSHRPRRRPRRTRHPLHR
jgi:Aldehyde dehydrogenase family